MVDRALPPPLPRGRLARSATQPLWHAEQGYHTERRRNVQLCSCDGARSAALMTSCRSLRRGGGPPLGRRLARRLHRRRLYRC